MALPSDITYDEKRALVHKFDSLLLLLYTFLLRHASHECLKLFNVMMID
jgi:hypothetical protein